MPRHFQIRTRVDPNDGLNVYECFRFNQFSGVKAGGYESSSGWNEGFEPDATNDTDGTPIGSPDADLEVVVDGDDPVLVSDTEATPLELAEGTGPEPEGKSYSSTQTWP